MNSRIALGILLLTAAVLINAADSVTNAVPLRSHLPVISVSTTQAIVPDRKVPCTVVLTMPASDASKTNLFTGTVRIHGSSSQAYPKKSLAIALSAPAPLLGMSSREHWVLNAAFIDRSLMRHKLSYDLFRSLARPGAPRYAAASRFVESERNGEYHGAFLLIERVDRALLSMTRFDSNATSHACIYKAIDHAANFSQPGHAGYEQREPDAVAKEYWAPLDELNAFVSRTNDAEFFNTQKGIGARVDLDNAMDFHLLVLLTSNMDGITKNFMIARDAARDGGAAPKFFFVPWDYDATFGRNWDATPVPPNAWLSNHLFDRLHATAEFRRKFAARWKELRAKKFSVETIHSMIEENVRTLGAAAERNATRWPTTSPPYPDKLTFAEDIAQMKAWVVARVAWLDTEIARRAQ